MNKFYIRLDKVGANGDYIPTLYVYDMDYGCWYKEDGLDITRFAYSNSGQMFGYAGNKIYGFGTHNQQLYLTVDEGTEPYVKWYAETGDMGYEYPDYKRVNRITVRAYIPTKSELRIQISYDDGPWKEVGTARLAGKTDTTTFQIIPTRCDHFKLRFSGHGNVRIYTLSRNLEAGSEER